MRISDWSSDVCSSDLIKAVLRCQTAQRRRHSGGIVTRTRKILDSKVVRLCFLASGITERNELGARADARSEEHTSELQSLMRSSYAVFCLKKKKTQYNRAHINEKQITTRSINT